MGVHARPRHRALLEIVVVDIAAVQKDVPTAALPAIVIGATAPRAPPVTKYQTPICIGPSTPQVAVGGKLPIQSASETF